MSFTTENYLKAICQMNEHHPERKLVRLGELAEELGVTPGTITTMIRGLDKKGMVNYVARSGVKLTPKGRKDALRIIRRHRIIESFLVDIMKMDWAEVHEDAEAMEHVISDQFLDRMDEMLGFPDRDPHGDPIPASGADLPAIKSIPLSKASLGEYEVSQVDDQEPRFLDWISVNQLRPGQRVTVTSIDLISGVLNLKVPDVPTLLPVSLKIASQIRVLPV